ncbi:DNA gyrase inhibitor YacG [Candidatus Magnetominusculus xianensis]|uniref:DNA gyrase inhibitor YacG n=1 Tax=Candidatus Magnetominusculus xianensis TaxID=1748249 RepID=A0ABR5SE93_9BACT|nr:DNA gyrase inhibitor YacG [Candidatus Magnetominusculus xianensis]KWT82068.1 DNA gyrase inhibitor YacG [Candidatus Magnetominusculus xianensis]MBF0404436.1 DNA gyrase inhibitor YacG [Nitrospirota bacterium]
MKIRCPRCAKEVSYAGNPYRPFCSHRCKTADLASWADERYRIPEDKTTEAATINQEEA